MLFSASTALVVALLAQNPQEIQKAAKVLEKSPGDSNSNLIMASHLAERGKWEEALLHLEKVNNPAMKEALEAEKKSDKNPFTEVEIGDAWSKAVSKAGIGRQLCLDRMSFRYGNAYGQLDNAWKVKVKDRVLKIFYPKAPGKAFEGRPQGWGGITDKDCGVEVTNRISRDGGSCLKLYAKKPGANIFLQTPVVGVVKGQKVEVSAWVLSDGTEGVGDSLVFSIASSSEKGLWSHRESVKPDLPVWTRIHAEVECPEESFRVRLDIRVTSPKGCVYIDSISIKVNGEEMFKADALK